MSTSTPSDPSTTGTTSSSSSSTDGSPRGEIGRQTYDAVRRLIDTGMNKTEAFAKVAKETGRSAATVTTTYYRMAKREPDGGGVRQSATAAMRSAKSVSGAHVERLAGDARGAIDALQQRIAELERQVETFAEDSRELQRIKRALGKN